MKNAVFSASELAVCTGGRWLGGAPAGELALTTDTRSDNSGRIFFALKGERFDAHDFLEQAIRSGCAALCVGRGRAGDFSQQLPCLEVDDTLLAYQAAGRRNRDRFPQLICAGITGSVGKTSVKEMVRAIFTEECGGDAALVLYTTGNTNNQIGVVQNLLRLNADHRFAVLEAGTSAPGEIAPLAAMIRPTVAVINSIAPCHLEKLGDLAGVAREKSAMFRALPAGATAVFPVEIPQGEILAAAAAHCRILRSGLGCGDVSARVLEETLETSRVELSFPNGNKQTFSWNLSGAHQAANAASAAAVAFAIGITPEVIAAGLAKTELPGMRMKKTVLDGVTYINDAYNANPASMRAALALLRSSADAARLVLVLGGMRELGPAETQEHRALLQLVREDFPRARVFCIGKEFSGCGTPYFEKSEEAHAPLAAALHPGDLVFAKGSRGNAVEKALPEEAR